MESRAEPSSSNKGAVFRCDGWLCERAMLRAECMLLSINRRSLWLGNSTSGVLAGRSYPVGLGNSALGALAGRSYPVWLGNLGIVLPDIVPTNHAVPAQRSGETPCSPVTFDSIIAPSSRNTRIEPSAKSQSTRSKPKLPLTVNDAPLAVRTAVTTMSATVPA